MLCGLAATVSADVEQVAWLEALSRTPEQSVVVPSLNVTLPLAPGFPPPALTVAVKMTDWPKVLGLAEETKAVLVVLDAVAKCA